MITTTNIQRRFLTYVRFTWWKEISDEARTVVGMVRMENYMNYCGYTDRQIEVLNELRIRFQNDYRKWCQAVRDGLTENMN